MTRPVTFSSSWNAPGQPAGNGLGPDAAVTVLTVYGRATATVASRRLASSAATAQDDLKAFVAVMSCLSCVG